MMEDVMTGERAMLDLHLALAERDDLDVIELLAKQAQTPDARAASIAGR